MARIRSVHPGIATDEDLAECSRDARLFFILLGTEADDFGMFEWKPVRLKMRLFPADDLHVDPLLDELVSANKIARFDIGGKPYGAIRNFTKYQRPKSPKAIIDRTPEINDFIGLGKYVSDNGGNDDGLDDGDPPVGGKSPAEGMKGGREEGRKVSKTPQEPPKYAFEGRVVRLNDEDFSLWRSRYHGIADFVAALQSADDWISGEDEKARSRWFSAVSAYLAKRHEAVMASNAPRPETARRGTVGAI